MTLTYWWLFRPSFYAGYSAERTFKTLAAQREYVAEPLLQNRKSHRESVRALGSGIKREDFILRGRGIQVAVEVKCRTARNGFYRVNYSELKRLEAMQTVTGLPVALAFFRRTGRGVRHESLEMYWLNWLLHAQARPERARYFEDSKQLSIPAGAMMTGFTLFDLSMATLRQRAQ